MRKLCYLLWLLPSVASAYVNLTGAWSEDGGYKMARQDFYPGGASSNTISRAWDGTTIKLFGGNNELITWVTYLLGGASDATNVMVTISSFTGTGAAAGSGFSAVTVSSTNVWDYTQRPYSLYVYRYLQIVGTHNGSGAWPPPEFEMRSTAARWQTPCTVNSNNDCIPNGGTWLFANRPDANKFYPDPAVPIEEFNASSFTVSASSSQAIGGEVYIGKSLPAGTYTAKLTVYEGAVVSTTIPIQLLVYNLTLPDTASLPVLADVGMADLDMRLTGTRFPANQFVDPYLTNHLRVAAFIHRHKLIEVGDMPASTQDYPSIEYQKHIDGTAYSSTYGYGNAPGVGVGDKKYVVGMYGGWISANWSTTNLANYCTNVSSWVAYANSSGVDVEQYTSDDEASASILAARVNQLSTWNSTVTACAAGGNTLPWFQTGNLPIVNANAPKVRTVASADWIQTSSNTWQAYETTFANTPGLTAAAYNSEVPGTDALLALQEAGLGPREVMVGDWKYGQKFHFIWSINYWNDVNNPGQTQNGWNANTSNDNNTLNLAKTFGYDGYPSTDSIKGHAGYHFSNGDGLLLYPAFDSVFTPNFGFNGVIGSWRLNMLTRGIQDVDIITQAYLINPTATKTIVNSLVQNAMWMNPAFTQADPTYIYGPRPWNETENAWEVARESLYQIIVAGIGPGGKATFTGNATLGGTAVLK